MNSSSSDLSDRERALDEFIEIEMLLAKCGARGRTFGEKIVNARFLTPVEVQKFRHISKVRNKLAHTKKGTIPADYFQMLEELNWQLRQRLDADSDLAKSTATRDIVTCDTINKSGLIAESLHSRSSVRVQAKVGAISPKAAANPSSDLLPRARVQIEPTSAVALYAAGAQSEASGSYIDAVGFYEQAAQSNYPEAQWKLAILFEHGRGVEMDKARALRLYEFSAKAGVVDAAYRLAQMYEQGSVPLPGQTINGRGKRNRAK